jgi:hypothetical protein
VCGRPVLPDAPIVIVRAAAWFIINLFIILLVQIANKMGSQKNLNFCGPSRPYIYLQYFLTFLICLSSLYNLFFNLILINF